MNEFRKGFARMKLRCGTEIAPYLQASSLSVEVEVVSKNVA